MSKTIERIIKIIVDILTGIVLFAILVLLYGKIEMHISGNNYSNYFGYTLFKVTTGSMGNAVKIDDVVIVKIGDKIKKDDIITYYEDKSFITHRVIDISNSFLVTKGDANNTEDSPIAKSQVIGRVVYTIRGLGIWQKVFSTPQILVSILVTLLLFDFAFSLKNKKELEKTRKLELEKIRDMSNTQIFKIDEIITKTKKERNLYSKNDKDIPVIEEDITKDDQPEIEVEEKETEIKQEKIETKEEKTESEITDIETLEMVEKIVEDVKKGELTTEEIELLTTQVIPIEEIKKRNLTTEEIELLTTQVIPIEEIKKMENNK